MRPFTARRLALAALVPALLALSVIPGCSNQGEGERCGDEFGASNNDDCESGLVCTLSSQLQSGSDGTNRCCYPDGRVTDSRCLGSGSTSATGNAGASSTAGASSADAGAAGQTMSAAAGAAGSM